ncbi:MAG TPA: OmpA family protein [Polyangiaceae bacterium]|jgi:outer membrane protein OmpA-like peptidoglycan-associated protein
MTPRLTRSLALCCAVATASLSCAEGPRLHGQIEGLQKIVDQAERNGAIRCAPRELATARSQLKFAQIELDQGFISKAQAHLWKAEPNAHAADFLTPPQYCAERGFIEAPRAAPGDRDGDGYLDPEDKCPDQPENFNGYQDEDGCPDDPDTDGDGIPDSVDQCVMDPEDKDGYLDEDGCPEPDNDLDGIPDAQDKCPNQPEDMDGYEDDDGCPDPDNDKDTVLDVQDQCPNEIGSTTQEPLGCPVKPALVVVTDCEVKITQQIHFEFNKDKIRPESFPVLDAVVEVMDKNPSIKLEVQGHTDNKGAAAYNKDLSNRRAHSVMKYLISHGTTNDRLTAVGYGMERPIVDNSTEQNRALNRRVQFVRSEGTKEGCPKTGSK